MRQKILSVITALALCLSLLPGAALAAEAGVTIGDTGLEAGKTYVADESGGVNELTEGNELPSAYLEYDGTTLTVHGTVEVSGITVNSDLTITGDGGSSLETFGEVTLDSATLTLDGGVGFTANRMRPGNPLEPGTFTTADNYSGNICIQDGILFVFLDVQSSNSIKISGGVVNCPSPLTLTSSGNISVTDGLLHCDKVTIEGENVELIGGESGPAYQGNSLAITPTNSVNIKSTNAPAITGAADISATGKVQISSSSGVPVQQNPGAEGLTVRNAQSVDITGSSSDDALIAVPVKFENCGEVNIANKGSGEILAEGGTITSDCYCVATNSDDEGFVITPDGKTLAYGGDIDTASPIDENTPATAYQAGSGWVLYEPSEGGNAPATLTLDNASCNSIRVTGVISVKATGENFVGYIHVWGSVTVDESDGTLNTLVDEFLVDDESFTREFTVYGNAEPVIVSLGQIGGGTTSLTILPGATLTIPDGINIHILDTKYLDNQGSIVNNGIVTLMGAAAQNATAQTVKDLHFTGSGKVVVAEVDENGHTVTVIYSNDGVKQLTPAGALDFSSLTTSQENTAMGYKWEPQLNDKSEIIGGTLTLQEGFNATTVTLPDAAVTIVTEGASSIGTLTADGSPEKTQLTFSGTGLLTVDQHIGIDGGDNNRITVAQGAKVVANNGISVGASGGVNGTVTVNGTLTVNGGDGTAIYTGKVAVGTTGVLEVSGKNGVTLNGMNGPDFSGLFTVTGDGRFTSNCSKYNVMVQSPSDSFPEGTTAEDAIPLSADYLPDDCEVKLIAGTIDLVRTSTGEVYTGPITIHQRHDWSEEWEFNETHHWHCCIYLGCTAKDSEAPHYYGSTGVCVCGKHGSPQPPVTPGEDPVTPGGSSGSSSRPHSSSSATTYTITVEDAAHGAVTANRRQASSGSTVTLTVTPDSGYALDTLTVTDSRGEELRLTARDGGKYTFTMPGRDVTVYAAFVPLPGQAPCDGGAGCPSYGFTDVEGVGTWYHEAVDYVLRAGLMDGYGGERFGPNEPLTRAQFVQILFNKAGKPAGNSQLQYNDVAEGEWYTDAIRWAVGQGIAGGYGNRTFAPNDNLTREQLAVMLWRYAGSPAATQELHFADAGNAGGYALDALRWAVANGVLNGDGNGLLNPTGLTTRAQAAQVLRNLAE